jgi:hypothetical protein
MLPDLDQAGAEGAKGAQKRQARAKQAPTGSGAGGPASDWTNYRQIAVKAVAEHVP